jgi:hypothetical protein
MKQIATILGKLLEIAKDAKAWARVLVFVIIGTVCLVAGAVAFSKTKVKKEDCGFCISQLKEVNETIKLILSDGKTIPATYNDTIIKPMTGKEKIETLRKLSLKLDTLLKKDSINKLKSKT